MTAREALAEIEDVVSAHYAGITPDDVGDALELLNHCAKLGDLVGGNIELLDEATQINHLIRSKGDS